jgi:hypothetical protein
MTAAAPLRARIFRLKGATLIDSLWACRQSLHRYNIGDCSCAFRKLNSNVASQADSRPHRHAETKACPKVPKAKATRLGIDSSTHRRIAIVRMSSHLSFNPRKSFLEIKLSEYSSVFLKQAGRYLDVITTAAGYPPPPMRYAQHSLLLFHNSICVQLPPL